VLPSSPLSAAWVMASGAIRAGCTSSIALQAHAQHMFHKLPGVGAMTKGSWPKHTLTGWTCLSCSEVRAQQRGTAGHQDADMLVRGAFACDADGMRQRSPTGQMPYKKHCALALMPCTTNTCCSGSPSRQCRDSEVHHTGARQAVGVLRPYQVLILLRPSSGLAAAATTTCTGWVPAARG
jgi:hypothetical protein